MGKRLITQILRGKMDKNNYLLNKQRLSILLISNADIKKISEEFGITPEEALEWKTEYIQEGLIEGTLEKHIVVSEDVLNNIQVAMLSIVSGKKVESKDRIAAGKVLLDIIHMKNELRNKRGYVKTKK